MEIKEIIDVLRVCADDEIICPACPHYDSGVYSSGTAACYQNLMLEAADTIESQQRRIAELEAALREQEERRWIPVTERLPKTYHHVLVIVSGKVGNITLDNAFELAEFSMDEGWILEMWPEWEDQKVTYWMPLPEPPKEDAACRT